MTSLLNVAKIAADIVLGLKSYKKFQQASMKSNKQVADAKSAVKEVKFQLDSLDHLFGGFGGVDKGPKGAAISDALKLVRGADALLDEAKQKLYDAQDLMREVDWEK
jgi:hypothetical protein